MKHKARHESRCTSSLRPPIHIISMKPALSLSMSFRIEFLRRRCVGRLDIDPFISGAAVHAIDVSQAVNDIGYVLPSHAGSWEVATDRYDCLTPASTGYLLLWFVEGSDVLTTGSERYRSGFSVDGSDQCKFRRQLLLAILS